MQSGPSKQGLPALHGVLPTKSEKTGALGRIKWLDAGRLVGELAEAAGAL